MVVVKLADHSKLRELFYDEWLASDITESSTEVFSRAFPSNYECQVQYDGYEVWGFLLLFADERDETVWILKWL